MADAVPITVAFGDGIGPEIMREALRVMDAAGAKLALEAVDIGERLYLRGVSSGIARNTWDSLRRTRVFFKGPITTPQGGGYKSLNVTVRKALGLFANVRPCSAYHPFVQTRHPEMDVVIIRENEEDLYAGIEHRQTDEVFQCLKLITRPGTERVIRYAFAWARAHGRRKVSCFTKDNIMKLTDGLFHKVFDEVAAEFPDIAHEHLIVDIGAARLASRPEQFDVIVLPNLYGDILSDVAAEITGSVGLAGSANIGTDVAMFEAIHGSAPAIAGQGIANPSGLLLAGVMLLNHIGQSEVATRVHNAWLATIEDGQHTADIFSPEHSSRRLSTRDFATAVIDRLGRQPQRLAPVAYDGVGSVAVPRPVRRPPARQVTVGVDVFVQYRGAPEALAQELQGAAGPHSELALTMVTNRGVKVWPDGLPETFCTDHWRCRFQASPDGTASTSHAAIAGLLARLAAHGIDFIKTEQLRTFDGQPGYSLGQGQ